MTRWGPVAVAISVVLVVAGCGGDEPGVPRGGSAATTTSESRPPFAGETVASGEVRKVSGLGGAKMQTLSGDNEVRGFRTLVKVLEFGTADQIDSDGGYRAADGSVLIAFRLSAQVEEGDGEVGDQVSASVSVDGTQRTLDDVIASTPADAGPTTYSYVVAVPEDRRSVDLELRSVGTVQSFDLLEGKPKGERPEALYRPDDATVLIQQALTPATFEIAPKGAFDTTQTVSVSEMRFSYFHPKTGAAPSSPDKAWMVFQGSGETESPNYYICVPTPASHRLIDDKQATFQPAPSSELPAESSIIGDAYFTAAFEVPGDITKATFSVAPTQAVCQISTGTHATVGARGDARIEVTVPEK